MISNNLVEGIVLRGGSTSNRVEGNFIGTDVTGTADQGNGVGIFIFDASGNTIGGLLPEMGDVIAYNRATGIHVATVYTDPTEKNALLSNRIFGNQGLAIDLDENFNLPSLGDPTPNDSGDGDTGPNRLQNYPTITDYLVEGSSIRIRGVLNSVANAAFALQFFSTERPHSQGYGEAEVVLGSSTLSTDTAGNAAFDLLFPVPLTVGGFITATATDADNDTSEISPPFVFGAFQFETAAYAANENDGSVSLVVVRLGNSASTGTVDFVAVDGTATAGVDYVTASGALEFAPGETRKTVNIELVNDALPEPDKDFTIRLENPAGGMTLGSPVSITVTIHDADSTPSDAATSVVDAGTLAMDSGSVAENPGSVMNDAAATGDAGSNIDNPSSTSGSDMDADTTTQSDTDLSKSRDSGGCACSFARRESPPSRGALLLMILVPFLELRRRRGGHGHSSSGSGSLTRALPGSYAASRTDF